MRRARSAALTPLAEALPRLLAGIAPVAPRVVPLAGAPGRVAADDVVAGRDVPASRVAARDGWAVDAQGIVGAGPYLPLPLVGPPAWVEAGAALPDGADAVLADEDLDGSCAIADLAPLEGVRRTGEDVGAGDRLVARGARVAPLHLVGLAAAGIGTVAVRVPRVALLVTGDREEDAVSPALSAALAALGADVAVNRVAGDAPAVAAALRAALRAAEADAVMVVGGTGLGRTDESAAGLARAGQVHAHGIGMTPGETAGFGTVSGRPVLLLPGRPEAALAAFLALGRPLAAALAGARDAPAARARLLRKVSSTVGLTEVVYVARREGGVLPLGGAGLPAVRLAAADGAILVPPDSEGCPEGTPVEVVPL